VTAPEATADRQRTRRAVFGAAFGFFVDMYDVNLPTVALVAAMSYFIPDTMSTGSKAIASALVFVATLIGRPIGSMIFGSLADRVGRRRTTLWSMSGCAICTLVIAVLPGYAAIGIASTALLIALRLVDGVFMGGEYAGATPLAMEASPNGRRGWYGGIVGAGSALANCAIALVTLVVLQFFPSGGPTAAYSVWGWRIPFLTSTVLSVVFLIYYSRTVSESETWQSTRKARNPIREVVLGRSRRDFAQIFVLMAGVWVGFDMASGFLPTALTQDSTLSAIAVTGALVIAQAVHAVFFPSIGLLSERVGRRRFIAWTGVATAVVCAGAFAMLASATWSGFWTIVAIALLVRITGGSVFAVTPSYLCERFPAATRGTGFGLGYSTPLLITSFYAYYQNWLGGVLPYRFTPVVLLVISGVLITVGALLGPESRGADLSAGDLSTQPEGALT
jgi:MFS family permease